MEKEITQKKKFSLINFKRWLKKKYEIGFDAVTHEHIFKGFEGRCDDTFSASSIPTYLAEELEDEFDGVSHSKILRYLNVVIGENVKNPLLDSLKKTVWDGVDRIEELCKMLKIDEDDKLSRILIKKWLLQAVAMLHNSTSLLFAPEFVLVLQGKQGIGKTRLFQHLCPAKYWSEGETIDPRDKDTVIRVTSKWICEIGELGSTMKKNTDIVKAFLTKSEDKYRAPYGKVALSYPRKTTFVGTVNDPEFLNDPTGSRRWGVIPLKENLVIDFKEIQKFDSMQLWAQVLKLLQTKLKEGYNVSNCFRLTQGEIRQIQERNMNFTQNLKFENEITELLEDLKLSGKTEEMTITEFKARNPELAKIGLNEIAKVLNKYEYFQKIRLYKNEKGIRTTRRVRNLPVRDDCPPPPTPPDDEKNNEKNESRKIKAVEYVVDKDQEDIAYTEYTYKTRDKSKEKEKAIKFWMDQHKGFVSMMDTFAFEIAKGSWGKDTKFDSKFVGGMLDDWNLEPDFKPFELLRVWRNIQI